eukprot:6233851-Amphidinium_carterae.1
MRQLPSQTVWHVAGDNVQADAALHQRTELLATHGLEGILALSSTGVQEHRNTGDDESSGYSFKVAIGVKQEHRKRGVSVLRQFKL